MHYLTLETVRRLRLQAQGLNGDLPAGDVAQAVRDGCGLQAQELPAATLAVRVRTRGLTAEDVRYAREVTRSVVLTWTMRGTMHLVAAEDLDWQRHLFGALFIHKGERRYQQLGLDDMTRRHAARRIREVLTSRGPLTRAELAQSLAEYGIPVDGQAIAHLVRFAALQGILCFGPEHNGELTVVLLEDWVKADDSRTFTEEQLVAEFTRRYLRAFAPAIVSDMVSWSGLSIGQIRAGFEALARELVEVETPTGTAWMLQSQLVAIEQVSKVTGVRLLPRFDNYLLGYQSRDAVVQDQYAKAVHPGGGIIRSVVTVDGQIVATWRLEHKRRSFTVIVQPFEPLGTNLTEYLEAEARDIGRFLQMETVLRIAGPE